MVVTIFQGQILPDNSNAVVPNMNIGDIVQIKKVKNSANKEHLVWLINNIEYGRVSQTDRYLLDGSVAITDEQISILPMEFDAKIVSIGTINIGQARVAFAINIPMSGEEVADNENGIQTMTFKVTGSNATNPAKASVLKYVLNGNTAKVIIKQENNKLVVYFPQAVGSAGLIDAERGNNPEFVKTLRMMLQSKTEVEATTLAANATSYEIEVIVESEALNELFKGMLEQEKNRIVAAGICSMEELNEREAYALSVGIDDNLFLRLLKTYRVYSESVQWRIPRKPEKLFQDKSFIICDSVVYILLGKPQVYVGNKGTGKNCAAKTIAWLCNRPLYSMSINRDTDKMDVLGSKTINATETDSGNVIQKVFFQPELPLECMEVGGIFVPDEINFADPATTAIFHSMMDDRRAIEVSGYRTVVADNNFAVICTMNVGYQGTNKLNEALNDRMEHILFPDYASIKHVLLEACPKANPKNIDICDKIYKKIKAFVDSNELDSECLTVRGFIDALEASTFMPLKRALQRSVVDKVTDQDYRESLQSIVNSIIP